MSRKMFIKLRVDVNGVHSFNLLGTVSDSQQLIKSFRLWASHMEKELLFQNLEFIPLRADTRDFPSEMSVIRIA